MDTTTIIVEKKHEPWKNQLRFTPRPKVRALIQAMKGEGEPVAETINNILNDYFSKMPSPERQRLLGKNHY